MHLVSALVKLNLKTLTKKNTGLLNCAIVNKTDHNGGVWCFYVSYTNALAFSYKPVHVNPYTFLVFARLNTVHTQLMRVTTMFYNQT